MPTCRRETCATWTAPIEDCATTPVEIATATTVSTATIAEKQPPCLTDEKIHQRGGTETHTSKNLVLSAPSKTRRTSQRLGTPMPLPPYNPTFGAFSALSDVFFFFCVRLRKAHTQRTAHSNCINNLSFPRKTTSQDNPVQAAPAQQKRGTTSPLQVSRKKTRRNLSPL